MNKEAKRIKVSIFGDQYLLVGDEAEGHIERSAQKVDECMQYLANATNLTDVNKIAVLAAVQMASKLLLAQAQINKFDTQCEKMLILADKELVSDPAA